MSASRWPLVGTLAQVWNICLLHSGRPAAVYRCKALKRPFTGATREGEAALPTRSEAVLADERAECHYPNTRRPRREMCGICTGPPQFTGRSRRAPSTTVWTGFRRRHVRALREPRFNTFFERETVRACATRVPLPILGVNSHALPSSPTAPLERLLRSERRASVRTTHDHLVLLAFPHPTGDRLHVRSTLVGSGRTPPPLSLRPSALLLPLRRL